MVSDKQREFNKYLHNYLRKLPKDRHKRSGKGLVPKKEPKEETESLEEKELERADKEVAKRSVFSGVYDWVFGSRAKVVTEEDFEESDEQLEERPKEREKRTDSYIDSVKRVFGLEKKGEEFLEEKEPVIKKVVLVRPEVERDMKFVLSLMDSMMGKINIYDRAKFLKSQEYKVYQDLRKRYR